MIYYILLTDKEEMKEKKEMIKFKELSMTKRRRQEAVQRLNQIENKKITRFNFIRQVFFSHKGNKNMEFIWHEMWWNFAASSRRGINACQAVWMGF